MPFPELLIPAGNLEKLRTAVLYGAHAVYVGVEGLSLRSRSSEISTAHVAQAIDEAHAKGVKVYAAANIFGRDSDLKRAKDILPQWVSMNIDAVIVSEPGMIRLIQ
jgi:putative protease